MAGPHPPPPPPPTPPPHGRHAHPPPARPPDESRGLAFFSKHHSTRLIGLGVKQFASRSNSSKVLLSSWFVHSERSPGFGGFDAVQLRLKIAQPPPRGGAP